MLPSTPMTSCLADCFFDSLFEPKGEDFFFCFFIVFFFWSPKDASECWFFKDKPIMYGYRTVLLLAPGPAGPGLLVIKNVECLEMKWRLRTHEDTFGFVELACIILSGKVHAQIFAADHALCLFLVFFLLFPVFLY